MVVLVWVGSARGGRIPGCGMSVSGNPATKAPAVVPFVFFNVHAIRSPFTSGTKSRSTWLLSRRWENPSRHSADLPQVLSLP